jgi:hypothetical protein
MARDIEEFLKKATERRAAQQQGRTAAPANPPRQPVDAPAQNREQPRPILRPPMPAATPVIVDDEEVEIVDPIGLSVSQHVSRHIDTKDITSRADSLGDEVALADDKMDARLHQKFDHGLGSLADQKSKHAGKKSSKKKIRALTPAQNVFEMLRSPKSIRDAILISEILKRPDFD